MRARSWLLPLAAGLALAAGHPTQADSPRPVRTDLLGDPLPYGVVARLGTQRLQMPGIRFPAFSADGKRLVGISPGELRLWDVSTGKVLWRTAAPLSSGCPERDLCLACSPDDRTIAVGYQDKTVRLYESTTGREQCSITASFFPSGVVFDPAGKHVVAGGSDGTVQLWDLRGKLLHHWGPLRSVFCVAFSGDGKRLAAVGLKDRNGREAAFSTWDIATGKEVAQAPVDTPSAYSGTFAPDGRHFAAPARDGKSIRLFDTATGKEVCRTEGTAAETYQVVFSSSGRLLTASCRDGTARVWDASTGKLVHQIKPHARGSTRSPFLLTANCWPWPAGGQTTVSTFGTWQKGRSCTPFTATGRLLSRLPFWGTAGQLPRSTATGSSPPYPKIGPSGRCGCGTRTAARRSGSFATTTRERCG